MSLPVILPPELDMPQPCDEAVDWEQDPYIRECLRAVECGGYPVHPDGKCTLHTTCVVEEEL
jgi:hypothetical protein